MTAEKKNLLDDDENVVEKKTDDEVRVPEPDKAGTAGTQSKPAAVSRTSEEKAQTSTDKADDKPRKKRRTKAEIEAAKAVEQGEALQDGEQDDAGFGEVDFEKYPLSATSGQVTGVVKLNGAVPVLEIALVGWIGEAPVSVAASQISDVEKVLKDLRKAAKDAKRS